jgi:hypothetical protein
MCGLRGKRVVAAVVVAACVLVPGRSPAGAPRAKAAADDAGRGPVVRVAYFVPSDREPIGGYVERFDRVLTEVQRFYRDGMAAAGYGPMTFRLDRDEAGKPRVHVVRGRQLMRSYGRSASGAVRREVKAALAKAGLDMDRETVVIFEALLAWAGGKATEIGPYCGGGTHISGTAWVYDDKLLDPNKLGSKQPGGYYHRPCSLGKFNTHYIGGAAHEMGHGFGLPHVCERKADRSRGKALMGGGNHTYGREKRGEGPGTFLSAASAMLLSRTRPFAGDLSGARARPSCRIDDLAASFADGVLTLTGRLTATPPAHGIAAYNDWARIRGDYDAVGWTCKVGSDGRFRLKVGEMRPGPSQLRLLVCHTNGARSRSAFDYEVSPEGEPDLDPFRYSLQLAEAVKAYARGDKRNVERLAREILHRAGAGKEARRKAAHLCKLIRPRQLRRPADIPDTEGSVPVSDLAFRSAKVGWGRPLRDQVFPEGAGTIFLRVGGKFYESGLYAHAPAAYVLELGGKWKRLTSGCGLQDGHAGSVVFVVRGDGKELFRSQLVRDRRLHKLDVDVSRVNVLELVVGNGGDGPDSDWGVWVSPELRR